MTDANNNSQNSTEQKVLASVKGVQGRVSVTSADGQSEVLRNGKELVLGDVVHAKGSSVAILDFGSAGLVSLGHDQSLTLDQYLMELLKRAEENGSLEEGVNFDLLAQAVEEGRSLEELLPAAAAGEEQDVDSGGAASSGAARLELTAQEVTPSAGFETSGLAFSSSDQAFPQGSEVDSVFLLTANNAAPQTTGLSALQVDEDVVFNIDLSSAFSDSDEDQTLSYEIAGLPEGLTFDPATGVVSGTPTNDDALTNEGSYTVTVTATDNSGGNNDTVTTEFELQVVNVNDAPTIDAPIDLGAIDEDGSMIFTPSQLLEGSSDIDLDELSISEISVVGGSGVITQNENGDFVFTPDENWNGSVELSYNVIDGNGGSVANTAGLVVNPVNDAPLAVNDGPTTTSTNTPVSIDVLSNDSDVDGDPLQVVSASAENGVVAIGENGRVTYTPNDNYFGEDTITYQISDGQGGIDEASIPLTVEYAPAEVSINNLDELDDTTPVFSGTSSNIVGDLTLTVNGNSFTVTPNEDGSWSYELPAELALADGEYEVSIAGMDDIGNEASASDQFVIDALMPEVAIADLQVSSSSQPTFTGTSTNTDGDFTLSVNGIDYTVTPNDDGSWSYTLPAEDALQDGNYSAVIRASDASGNTANDSDDFIVDYQAPSVSIDDLDLVTTQLPTFSGSSQNTDGDLVLEVNGISYPVTPAADGTWTFTLPAGDELIDGSYIATIRGGDDQGNQAASSDAFVIDAVNDMPLVTGEFTGVTVEGDLGDVSQASGTIDINDPDVGVNPSFENTSITGNNGTLVLENGVWTYTLDQASVQDLDAGDVINDNVTLTATDGTEQVIEIAITGTDDAPTVSGTFTGSVVEGDVGDVVTTSGTISIADVDGDDTPNFENTSLAGSYGNLELVDGVWTYTLEQIRAQSLNVGDSVEDPFTLTADDGTTQSIIVTITGTNDVPVLTEGASNTEENSILNGSVPAASDVDGSVVSYSLVSGVSEGGLSFSADGSFSFDPGLDFDDLAAGETRDISFEYSAQDDQGGVSETQTYTITVTGSNDLPTASSDTVSSTEETVLNANVPSAADIDGSIESYTLVNDVAEGSLTFNSDGSYSFDPSTAFDDLAVGETREVSFSYTATDNQGGVSEPAIITISVTGGNDLPIVSAGSAATNEDTILSSNVPAASDVDGTIASYALVDDVAEGSLTFNADGSYSFDPGADFDDLAVGATRDVSFTYTATDDQGGVSAPATITVTVTGTNDLPTATSAATSTDEETVLSANVPAASDVDGSIASYALVDDVTEGSLTFNADGSYSFDPGADFDDLAVGETRDVSFTYTATDDQGGVSAPATITITVTGTNDLPAVSAGSAATNEDTILSSNVPAASDVDGTITSYALVDDVAEGSLTFNADGSYSFDPGTAFDDLAVGAARDVSFTYTATDDQGGVSAPATITVTVTGTNDLPTVSAGSAATNEDTILSSNVPAASDVDGTIASYALVDDVAEGSLTFNADGSYSFDPGADFDDLAVGATRDVSFTYTATDDQGGVSAPSTITVTVTGTNDLPTATSAATSTNEETVLSANVPAASDVDGTIASYALVDDVAEGSLTFNADGSYSFDPGAAFDDLAVGATRDVSFTYTATDDQGGVSAPATITVTVTGTNDLPTATSAAASTDEETVLSANVPAASDVDGTIASYALVDDVTEGSLTFNADGSYSFDPGTAFDDLAAGETRDVSFTYTATDDQGGVSAPATITVTVTGTNDLPTATSAAASTNEETVLSANVPAASDVDGTIASYALVDDVAEGSLTFNADGSYSFDPGTAFDDLAEGATRDVSFTYTATDDQGGVSAPATITLTVTGTNDLPIATSAMASTDEDTILTSNVPAASDVDGSIASYALVDDVAEGSLTFNADGSYSFDPGADFDDLAVGETRDVSFTYTATDDQGSVSVPATITVTVTGTNDLPTATSATASTDEDTILSSNVPAASDVDGTIASYALVDDVAEGSLTFNADGRYSFDPGADFDDLAVGATRDVSFTYTATDDQGGVSTPVTIAISVTGTLDAPVVNVNDGEVATETTIFQQQFSGDILPSESGSSSADANGLSVENTTLSRPSEIRLEFLSETAGYSNSVGWYQINSNGEIVSADIIWRNGNNLSGGDIQTLQTNEPTQIGFFIVADGDSRYGSQISDLLNGSGVIRFEDANGNLATVSTPGAVLYYYSGGDEQNPSGVRTEISNTYMTTNASLNPDGFSHVASGLPTDGSNESLLIGFEDLPSTGSDWDLRDFVFSMSIQSLEYNVSDIAPDLSITDDGSVLSSAIMQIELGRDADELVISDAMRATAESYGLTLSFDADSKTFSITGNASIDQYTEVLSSIQIGSVVALGEDPREISLSVVDLDGLESNLATIRLNSDPSYDFQENDFVAGNGVDPIIGGEGDDILISSAESDLFVWRGGDQGTTADPANDVIIGFQTGSGGDVLDFSDLLQGESEDAATLDAYLDFSSDGTDTTISINTDGASGTTQEVILEGVDLTLIGNDQQIIQQLLTDGNLNTD